MLTSIRTPPVASRASPTVTSLSQDALRKRLRDLTEGERELQVDFLLYLSEFDRRKGYLDAGHGSLWSYCLRELHLREGPAARRIGAMRVLRRHPELEEPLRDGRLCMSTVTMIAPLFAAQGVSTLVSRAAYLSKAEVEHLVATLRPVAVPRDGVRLIPSFPEKQRVSAPELESDAARGLPDSLDGAASADTHHLRWDGDGHAPGSASTATPAAGGPTPAMHHSSAGAATASAEPVLALNVGAASSSSSTSGDWPRRELQWGPEENVPLERVALDLTAASKNDRARAELRPVAAEQWSLRVTMDAAMKNDLETLESLLSHKLGKDLTSLVREALRCAVEKHGRRRGAVPPTRSPAAPKTAPKATGNRAVPNAIRNRAAQKATRNGAAPMPANTHDARVSNATKAASAVKRCDRGSAPAEGKPQSNPGDQPIRSEHPTRRPEPKPGDQLMRSQQPTPASAGEPVTAAQSPRAISAAVRREVWSRDGGCCSWRGKDGRRCGSRWKLEIDHIVPAAIGGAPTVDNLRLLCRPHNMRHAEKVFGRRHMAKFAARSRASP